MKTIRSIILALSCTAAFNSYAFDVQTASPDDANSYLNYQGIEPIKEKGGATPWTLFDHVKEINIHEATADGFDNYYVKPGYTEEIKKLDGQKIKLYGYMFPLTESEQQTNVLIGAFPTSCPYHYHVSPKMVVEVNLQKPIKFTFDPVLIEGTLQLKYKADTQVFYYLNDAKKID